MRISLGTNRSAKILSVLLLLKNKEIQYEFFRYHGVCIYKFIYLSIFFI
jgi:hypothetical protein